jgi:hypothetical protein
MDPRLIEAFIRTCLEIVKDSNLPLEPSDFQKHLSEFTTSEFKLSLKFSSFKKIGKLLEHMHSLGAIDYSEPKTKDHKVITKIHRSAKVFAEFAPEFKLKRVK